METFDKEKESVSTDHKRTKTWKRSFDFLLSLLGLMIGLGNVWRFPYLCYEHGGGAFVVAYLLFVIFLIFPLLVLEMALGQFTGKSPAKAWLIVPLFKGLGPATMFLMFYCNIFYPLLLTWSLRWLVASFSADMAWTTCNNTWNTNNCFPLYESTENLTVNLLKNTNPTSNLTSNTSAAYASSVEEFWNNYILGVSESNGIEHVGGIKTDLFYCFTFIWVAGYFSAWKGISWTSKIVYVTATLPLVMILVVLVRGVTLEGAGNGITKYLKPDLRNLSNVKLWTDAASQVLYSLGAATGSAIVLSSYNKFNHNFMRTSIILTTMNAGASFLSGFAIFSVLGFLANAQNVTVDDVADSGPGLVFVAYPTALSLLPLPHVWFALFFIMLIFLGFDSFFVYNEALISCIREQFPCLFKQKWSNETMLLIVNLAQFVSGLAMTTYGGIYIFNIFNTYSFSGWCLYFIAFVEMTVVGWIYGADKMCDNIQLMLGYDIPRLWFKICWKFIGPGISLVVMIYSFISYQPLKHTRSYIYPKWADGIGWMMALNSVLCVPIAMVWVLWHAKGRSLKEKLQSSLQPMAIIEQARITGNREEEVALTKVDLATASST